MPFTAVSLGSLVLATLAFHLLTPTLEGAVQGGRSQPGAQ